MTPSHQAITLTNADFSLMEFLWHSPESKFTVNFQATILCNEFERDTFEIMATCSLG